MEWVGKVLVWVTMELTLTEEMEETILKEKRTQAEETRKISWGVNYVWNFQKWFGDQYGQEKRIWKENLLVKLEKTAN